MFSLPENLQSWYSQTHPEVWFKSGDFSRFGQQLGENKTSASILWVEKLLKVSFKVRQACCLWNLRKPTCECSSLPFIRILIWSVCQNFSSAHDALSNIFHISFTPFTLPHRSVVLHRFEAGLPLWFLRVCGILFYGHKAIGGTSGTGAYNSRLCFWRSSCPLASSLFWKQILFFAGKCQVTMIEIPLW